MLAGGGLPRWLPGEERMDPRTSHSPITGDPGPGTTKLLHRLLGAARRIDILPYHRLGAPKYQRLEREYPLGGLPSLPAERAAQVRRVLEPRGLEVHVGG